MSGDGPSGGSGTPARARGGDGDGGAGRSAKRPRPPDDGGADGDGDGVDDDGNGNGNGNDDGNDSDKRNNNDAIGKSNNDGTAARRLEYNETFEEVDPAILRDAACGSCVLCRMPRCERCSLCRAGDERLGGCCWRKTCIAVPIEFKLRSTSGLGFPEEGWRFAFDDPQKTLLVVSTKRVPAGLVGLRLVSPGGMTFHSLESAFAHIPWEQHDEDPVRETSDITDAVERFLRHVGSSQYVSLPHFLVGKSYCAEFVHGAGSNVVLFGRVVACMGPPLPSGSTDSRRSNNSEDDAKSFFIVKYDPDALSIAREGAGAEVRPFQLLSSERAWGACVSYERRTCCRRDGRSAIRNIDQATAVETWVAPDMRLEETTGGTGETPMPRLTVFARGYKFVFRTRAVPCEDCAEKGEKRQLGVFATCESLGREDGDGQEINLKPGELIDLGTFGDEGDSEGTKPLSAFIIKNYIHKFKVGRWGIVSGYDDLVCDTTDDATGALRDTPSRRVLSYVRKRPAAGGGGNDRRRRALLHARVAPDLSVHALFGVPYEGNWAVYEAGMRELVPLFGGGEVEVFSSRSYGLGSRRAAGPKYMQSIGAFQTEDVVESALQLERTFDSLEAIGRRPDLVDRAKPIIKCLLERTEKLLDMFSDVKLREKDDGGTGDAGPDNSPLLSARGRLNKLVRMLEDHMGK